MFEVELHTVDCGEMDTIDLEVLPGVGEVFVTPEGFEYVCKSLEDKGSYWVMVVDFVV